MSSNYNRLVLVISTIVSIAAFTSAFDVNADERCKDADPGTITYYSVDGDCGAYIECYGGIATDKNCPPDLWWHQDITDCDYPGFFCPTWQSEICIGANPNVITYKPFGDDCTQYVECFDDVPQLFTCAPGTWWHQKIEDCDFPGDYCTPNHGPPTRTSTSSTTSTTTKSTTTTSTTSTTPTHGPGPDPRCVDNNTNYWPHPTLCSRYIECYGGDSYEMECPPNLYFSDSKKECVPADESECCAIKPC